MAVFAPLRPFVAPSAIALFLHLVLHAHQKIREAEAEAAARAAEVQVKVQPEGPSFREVLGAIPDPVMIVSGFEPDDIAGRWIVYANTSARKIFGIERDNELFVSAIRNPEVLECIDEALFGGITTETQFETTGGARDQYWRAYAAPLAMTDGQVQRLAVLVVRDETDTRRMERMRADFLANASHELRTPLASLTGFIETLRGPAKDDEKARDKFLTIMAAQADRMGRLINDLLSLSRIELNEHIPPSGDADLSQAVRDVVDGLSLMAREKGVRLTVRGARPGAVIGDRDQILQVVQNLADNALKYAPRDTEVTIDLAYDLSLEQAVSGSDSGAARLVLLRPDRNIHDTYTRVTVRDNGPGIRREFLPRLAERFYRVEGQKSGDRLGTGLGLAIVKHIVNRHRGGLVVESQGQNIPGPEDILERDGARVRPLMPQTFTAFTACFPQRHVLGAQLRLVSDNGLKDAG
jgi:two-component system phosphate regulon sensor histidine kinase PhoR